MQIAVQKINTNRRGMRFEWLTIPDTAIQDIRVSNEEGWLEVRTTIGTYYAITWRLEN